ncbi:hypothetical protein [Mesorhizobium sp. M1B.F.Ca.ET.045.04.1.1]|uniref:Gfo/Idh/MocA family protein n=1 Tax=Mesorhizobium sp. M1B.F.Ca.ET.045.04.1.1 TaxID=2493673 RepID=UPI000F75FC8D|nr:hypothetical protein [Mesorhizobium sp. M1B.F.Ca.ET.045.04.1.1]AZO27945.1 hypothetical protein EJ071_11355 [Mesorhizobium sp. M1B.F.Ca.ET.045.04.1.1]
MAHRPGARRAVAVLADIGVHAFNLASFISGFEAEAVSADLFTAVPGRRLDDNAHVLVRWMGGAHGTILASQTSPATTTTSRCASMATRPGSNGRATRPEELRFSPMARRTRTLAARRPRIDGRKPGAVSRTAGRASRGLYRAFANFYRRRRRHHPARHRSGRGVRYGTRGAGARRGRRCARREVRGGGGGVERGRRRVDSGEV